MKNIYIPLPMDLYLEYTNKLVDSTVEDVAEQIVVNMEEFASKNPESLPLFSYVINFYYGKIPLSIFPIVKKKITNMFFARVWKVEFNQKNEGYYIKVHPLMDNKEYIDFCEKNENDINELLIKYKVKK